MQAFLFLGLHANQFRFQPETSFAREREEKGQPAHPEGNTMDILHSSRALLCLRCSLLRWTFRGFQFFADKEFSVHVHGQTAQVQLFYLFFFSFGIPN